MTGDRSRRADLLERIITNPHLARAVAQLPPQVLHAVIQRVGLDECGELLALATTEQVAEVLDLDLWRLDRPGTDERFDAVRFCEWLDALASSGTSAAAKRLADMDPALLIVGLAAHVAVYDQAALAQIVDGEVVRGPDESRLYCDVAGYRVVARGTDWWDTIVSVLAALAEEQTVTFHRVMRGCRRLSNSRPERDGFHDLLDDAEQGGFDLAAARERRRERRGYIAPDQARAFLQSSRELRTGGTMAPVDPIFTASLRVEEPLDQAGEATEEGVASSVVIDMLRDADALPEPPRALLAGGTAPTMRFARLQQYLADRVHGDEPTPPDRELAFLANVLVAGGAVQERPFTSGEASEAAAAVCNLGLENWPPQWPAAHNLVSVFQVGWAVLHREVVMFAARQLLHALGQVRCSDRDIQMGLVALQRELTKHGRAGAPWQARNALDVLAILDTPSWAALLGLIAEYPVMLANVCSPDARPLRIDPSLFEHISTNAQIAWVREFTERLPDVLSR